MICPPRKDCSHTEYIIYRLGSSVKLAKWKVPDFANVSVFWDFAIVLRCYLILFSLHAKLYRRRFSFFLSRAIEHVSDTMSWRFLGEG